MNAFSSNSAALRERRPTGIVAQDLDDAFASDTAINAFEADGRHSRPLSALEAETDR